MEKNYQTLNYLRYLLKKEPELAFKTEMTADEFPIWQKKVKDKAKELMGLNEFVYDRPICNLIRSRQRDGYRVEKYEISSEEGLWNTMLVLIPDGVSETNRAPGVLCMPGSTWTKEQLAGEEFMDLDYEPAQQNGNHRYYYANCQALHYVRRGFVAIACDDFFAGETQYTENIYRTWEEASKILICMGRSMLSITVGMRLAQLKWLKACPFVDEKRIGMTAHSLGVEAAMLAGMLDEDVQAFVFNDFLSDSKQRILACSPPELIGTYISAYKEYMGCFRYFTYPDLLAAFAPRKLLICEGGVTELLDKVSKAYETAGAKQAFKYHYYREYADPASRKHDYEPLPTEIPMSEYFEYANVVPDKHFFKFELAVPWLDKALNQ